MKDRIKKTPIKKARMTPSNTIKINLSKCKAQEAG
jgi:hypothetical protein